MYRCPEIKLIKLVLVWLGMSPPKLISRTNYSHLLPMFIHFSITFSIIHTVLAYPERFFQTTSSVNYFLDCLQVFRILLLTIVQTLENIFKSRVEDNLNVSIEAIDTEIFARHSCSNTKTCSFCRKRSLKFVFYSRIMYLPVMGFVIDFTVMKIVSETHKLWSEDLYIREFSASMTRVAAIHILCYFSWVSGEFIKFGHFLINVDQNYSLFSWKIDCNMFKGN